MRTQETCRGPLAGIRAVDLCDAKGAFCTKLLADLGAEVIKVQRPGQDLETDRLPKNQTGQDPAFFYQNTNKLAITLDYLHADGRDLLLNLIEKSDIVVESFAPGYLESIGLGFNTLRKHRRDLIMASITWFGQTGPRKEDAACDLTIAAASGQAHVTGSPGLPPLAPFGQQSHNIGSLYAAVGILLALQGRRRSNRGSHIDISLQEAAASTLDHVWPRYFHNSQVAQRSGGRHWDALFHILPCRDGFIHLTTFLLWPTLVDWLDGDGMAEDLIEAKWRSENYRRDHAAHVIAVLAKWTRNHTVDELFHLGQLMGFPWAPVCAPDQVPTSEQLQSRKFFRQIPVQDKSLAYTYPGVPYRFHPPFELPENRAPFHGEHNGTVYEDMLGLDRNLLSEFASKGVI